LHEGAESALQFGLVESGVVHVADVGVDQSHLDPALGHLPGQCVDERPLARAVQSCPER
jgi:hypothetical protein